MWTHLRDKRRGQVLVMVTLALFAMCGMIGLVVDLGWSYFVRKYAQAAADSAALAAVRRAQDLAASSKSPSAYTCGAPGSSVVCTDLALVDCPGATGNLAAACLYAQQNGFTTSGRQHVTVQAADQPSPATVVDTCGQTGATIHHPPTTGCVDTFYWVTVRVAEQTPQLFSAILGNPLGLTSARATAAIGLAEIPGALFLLGRGEPWNPSGGPVPSGTNLFVGGGPDLIVQPGINMASSANGPRNTGWAGEISGSGTVTSDWTSTRGGYDIQGSGTWNSTPSTGAPDGQQFMDPYDGLGQPPLTNNVLPVYSVPGGNLNAFCGNACGPGNYIATKTVGSVTVATGDPIVIGSDVTFSGGGFGNYNFFGGLQIGGAKVTFGPGRYVIAGVNNQTTPALNINNNSDIVNTSNDAGRVFILTDSTYPGLATQVQAIQNVATIQWPGPVDSGTGAHTLYFSQSSILTGNNSNSAVQLHGLVKDNPNLPPDSNNVGTTLNSFASAPVNGQGAGVVIWQDQRNSYVTYTPQGSVDTSCGSINSPCMNSYPSYPSSSPQLSLWASPYSDLQGVIYQPRGAWTVVQANGDYTGALRIVTGAMKFQGTGTLTLTGPSAPFTTYKTALIE